VTYRVLVADNVHEQGIALLRDRQGFEVDVHLGLSGDALKDMLVDHDALVVRSATLVTEAVLRDTPRLRVIGRAGSGLDNVDVREATRRGIVVMNVPGGNSESTSEHTIAMIMAIHRHIPQAVSSMKQGLWEKKKFQGREMAGRVLGVIGLGRVGSLVAQKAVKGLRMTALGFDPATTPQAAAGLGVKLAPLDEIFRRSDIITVHTPLNQETQGLINESALAKMKDGVFLVNCARGGIIDEAALLKALDSGKVGAAALDVFAGSPPGDSPLVMHPKVLATPHLGASTREAQINVSVAVVEQIIDYLERGVIRNAVNVPALDAHQSARLGPFLDLARRLGQFIGGLGTASIDSLEVMYRGEVATMDFKPITNAALVGFLSRFEGTEVNEVNAPVTAQDRGIRVSETTVSESPDHGSTLELRTVSEDGGTRSIHGALIRRIGREPRIIGINGFVTEAVPAGPMLVVTNRDVPGMIAGISGTLARSGINIAQMNLSRDCAGGRALSIINIDTPLDQETADAIRSIDGILSVHQVILDP
jgi:D-3-phosphoglycerate dehydrogenase